MRFDSTAIRMALIFSGCGVAWVVGGDWLIAGIGPTAEQARVLQVVKGLIFVGISTVVFYALVRADSQKTLAAQSERRHVFDVLENAIGNTNRPFFTWNSETGAVFLSGGTTMMLGLGAPPRTLSNDEWRTHVHPEDLPAILDIIQPSDPENAPSNAPGQTIERTFRIRHANGTYLWVRTFAAVMAGADSAHWSLSGNLIDITDLREKESEVERANTALRALVAANRAIVLSHSRTEMLDSVCRTIAEAGNFPLVWVGLPCDDETKSIQAAAAAGEKASYLDGLKISWDRAVPHGRGPTGRALRRKTLQRANKIDPDYNYAPWAARPAQFGLESSVAIPILNRDRAVGVLTVYSKEPKAFSALNEVVLTNIGEDLGYALNALERDAALRASEAQKEHALAQVRDMLVKVVAALGRTLGARDPYTAGHQVRVAELSTAIARAMGVCDNADTPSDEPEACNVLRLGALIHDIGKIGIPTDLLSKPSHLAPEEFALLKRHPSLGAAIIDGAGLPPAISAIIEQHHERFDGSGYPLGISGDEIALEARIVGVADVVEAIMAHRPYRAALGMDAALQEIESGSGTRYDPAVAAACLKLFRQDGFAFNAVPQSEVGWLG